MTHKSADYPTHRSTNPLRQSYVPESPRWLVTQGKNDEAKVVLEDMAKKNRKSKELPSHWELKSSGGKNKEKKSNGVRDLVSHPYVLLLTLIQIFSWFVNSCTYYGLTMAASNLGGDVYISTALSGLIEIPACITAAAVIDRVGRRITLCTAMLLGGTACVLIFIPVKYVTVITGLALCGKLSISASFSVAYVHSAEIFPTIIRNSAVGIVSVAARVGGIVAPFILMLGDFIPNMQFTVFGLMTFLAGVLNLKLPETLGQPMPENIADVIAFRNNEKVVKSGKKYQKLNMVDEEVGAETVRPRTPTKKGKLEKTKNPFWKSNSLMVLDVFDEICVTCTDMKERDSISVSMTVHICLVFVETKTPHFYVSLVKYDRVFSVTTELQECMFLRKIFITGYYKPKGKWKAEGLKKRKRKKKGREENVQNYQSKAQAQGKGDLQHWVLRPYPRTLSSPWSSCRCDRCKKQTMTIPYPSSPFQHDRDSSE
nr:LOW QUALITY PROTEIN: solute carrier family 22 member 15-like [Penaeus vannamei]